ncbi:hypothetical protein P43SY_001215 [Pythium insidiosum]|uniref:Ubiquitin-activating enzyme E1 C-terminal domain-containing protein n=1 Tax=Pythium insidiosum TaxID=114742 RepID=A0AAD5LL66_PYTIN|nr:hypothetical protein P43SY_001215 [Pythium insidiosum]
MAPERHAHEQVAASALREGSKLLDCDGPATRVDYAALRTPSDGLRVNKWDAQILDGEILDLLRAPFRSMFSMFDAGKIDRIKPEMDLVLASILFWSSTGMRREFLEYFTKEYDAEISMISYGTTMLYATYSQKSRSQERMEMKMSELVETLTKKPVDAKYLILEVCADDADGEDIDLPSIRYKIRNHRK